MIKIETDANTWNKKRANQHAQKSKASIQRTWFTTENLGGSYTRGRKSQ